MGQAAERRGLTTAVRSGVQMFYMSPEMVQALQELTQRNGAKAAAKPPAVKQQASGMQVTAQRPLQRLLRRFTGQTAQR